MATLILSDLHLGAGDALEDFLLWGDDPDGPPVDQRAAAIEALDNYLADFLRQQFERMAGEQQRPRLLLLGDIFDLWQVQRPREAPIAALRRIITAHPMAFLALRNWIQAGGELVYTIGNHDHPMVDVKAWGELAATLPGINESVGGGPVHYFEDQSLGLFAEHGHRWDPFNRMGALHKANADCPGRRIVRGVANRLEPIIPLIDKGATMMDLLMILWRFGQGEGLVPWQEIVRHLIRLIGSTRGPLAVLNRELEKFAGDHRREPDLAGVRKVLERSGKESRRRFLLGDRRRSSPMSKLPRLFAHGHDHSAGKWDLLVRGQNVRVLNPGTWRPVARVEKDGNIVIEQRLTAILVDCIDVARIVVM